MVEYTETGFRIFVTANDIPVAMGIVQQVLGEPTHVGNNMTFSYQHNIRIVYTMWTYDTDIHHSLDRINNIYRRLSRMVYCTYSNTHIGKEDNTIVGLYNLGSITQSMLDEVCYNMGNILDRDTGLVRKGNNIIAIFRWNVV